MIDGQTSHSGTPYTIAADLMLMNGDVVFTEERYLMRVVAYLDGLGGSAAPQAARGVVYSGGALVAAGDTIVIENDQPPAWVPLPFSKNAGLPLKPERYKFGVHAGQTGNAIRTVVADGETPAALEFPSSPFVSGAPELLQGAIPSPVLYPSPALLPGGGEPLNGPIAAYLETLEGFSVPLDQVSDDYLESLPFPLTQRIFNESSTLPTTSQYVHAGWYGTRFDEAQGSTAIVRSDGPLAELVGERLWVESTVPNVNRSVVVYVHDLAEFPDANRDEDLMLARRAFLHIANLGDDAARVRVMVMA